MSVIDKISLLNILDELTEKTGDLTSVDFHKVMKEFGVNDPYEGDVRRLEHLFETTTLLTFDNKKLIRDLGEVKANYIIGLHGVIKDLYIPSSKEYSRGISDVIAHLFWGAIYMAVGYYLNDIVIFVSSHV